MIRMRRGRDERGQASMVTVAMFMMLFAVVAVSFTYIVVTSTRQTVNNTLQASAKSAAESGIEDAKRLLVYCYDKYPSGQEIDDTDKLCQAVIGHTMSDTNCTNVLNALADSKVAGSFKIESDGGDGHRVSVGGTGVDGSNPEYYQCLRIATRTKTYEDILNENGSSVIIPIRAVHEDGRPANPTTIVIRWHRNLLGEDGDGLAELNNTSGTGLPSKSTWLSGGQNRPAAVRAEVLEAPRQNVSTADLVQNDAAVTLRPVNDSGTPDSNSVAPNDSKAIAIFDLKPAYNTGDLTQQQPNDQYRYGDPLKAASCKSGKSSSSSSYACYAALKPYKEVAGDGNFDSTNSDLYLRLNTIYKDTHFEVSIWTDTEQLYFDGVQPQVDVTGKSADSFARLSARLKQVKSGDEDRWWPEYAIDTEGEVCKNIDVFYDYGKNNCAD